MSAVPAGRAELERCDAEVQWAEIASAAPQMAKTMRRYLGQVATFLAPSSVVAAEAALRLFARWLVTTTSVVAVADVSRRDIEDFKVYLASRRGVQGGPLAENTQRQRLRMLRVFFERIIEWDWDDAPTRNPILNWDLPRRPEPLPKFLDDRDAAKFMTAARASTDPRDRLVVELLARTGMRSGELLTLDADAVVRIGHGHWLRIPLGKLRNDRYVPLHPQLVELLADWTATNLEHIRAHRRLIVDHRGPISRHTLATQAINRGMRLEAIAALLGHRKMEMTLIYARIANRVVADEYAAVSAQIDALYGQPPELPADYETTGMARLRREAHARMLGNGLCTRPVELDCRMESACETCAYFRTSVEFLPTLTRQRDHARERGQDERAALFDGLIRRAEAPTEDN